MSEWTHVREQQEIIRKIWMQNWKKYIYMDIYLPGWKREAIHVEDANEDVNEIWIVQIFSRVHVWKWLYKVQGLTINQFYTNDIFKGIHHCLLMYSECHQFHQS